MGCLRVTLLIVVLVAACTGNGAAETTVSTSPPTSTTVAPGSTTPVTTSTTVDTTAPTTIATVGPSVLTLVTGPVPGGPISGVATVDGYPIVAHVSADGALQLVLCDDALCEGLVTEVTLGYPGESATVDLALTPEGFPVVVTQSWSQELSVLYVCSDPTCGAVETAELGDNEPCVRSDGSTCQSSVAYPSIVIPSDGLPRVVYLNPSNPTTVKLASCQDPACQTFDWTTIDTLPFEVWTGAASVRINASDRLLVSYWYSGGEEMQQSLVAVCEDPSCATSPTILSIDGGVFAQTTPGATDDEYLIWYQTGAEALPVTSANPSINYAELWSDYSDFMVIQCNADGCTDAQPVDVGEDWLLAHGGGALRLFTTNEGTTGALFNHASRAEPTPQPHITTCTDLPCTEGSTHTLGIETMDGPFFDVITSPDARPRIVFISTEGTIDLYRCATSTCMP